MAFLVFKEGNKIGLVAKPKTWVDNENVFFNDINSDFDTLYNLVNGGLDNSNISSSAAIVESKLSFAGNGHGHSGGSDGKLIAINRAFPWFLAGNAVVANSQGARYIVPEAMTIKKVWLIVRTAPVGSALIIDIKKNGVTIWSTTGNRGQIAAGAPTGSQTSFDVTALAAGDYLDLDVVQVGSTTPGLDLSVMLETSQP